MIIFRLWEILVSKEFLLLHLLIVLQNDLLVVIQLSWISYNFFFNQIKLPFSYYKVLIVNKFNLFEVLQASENLGIVYDLVVIVLLGRVSIKLYLLIFRAMCRSNSATFKPCIIITSCFLYIIHIFSKFNIFSCVSFLWSYFANNFVKLIWKNLFVSVKILLPKLWDRKVFVDFWQVQLLLFE